MKAPEVAKQLDYYEQALLTKEGRDKVLLTLDWRKKFPREAGVYAFFKGGEIVYVGETGSIQGRMNDMRNSLNHTLRRNVGAREFCDVPGFEKATSRKKFPPHIEEMVVAYLCDLEVKALPICFGRKEIEEDLVAKYSPIYNQKTKRGRVTKKSPS